LLDFKNGAPLKLKEPSSQGKKKVIIGQSDYLGAEVWAERPGIKKNKKLNNPVGKLAKIAK
jgi:hypothetical protein